MNEFIKNISKSSTYKQVIFITSDEKLYRKKNPKFSLNSNKITLFSADCAVCNSKKKKKFIRKQVAEVLWGVTCKIPILGLLLI